MIFKDELNWIELKLQKKGIRENIFRFENKIFKK